MKFERTKNSTRTFAFGIIYNILSTLLPFATRTIIIYYLGSDYVGLSSLFTSILSMLNMTELGLGSAVTFCMYKAVAADDKKSMCSLLAFIKKLYRIIGVVVIALGLACLPFLPVFIKSDYPSDINIYLLYIIYLAETASSYILFSYRNVEFTAYQRGDVVHKINSIIILIRSIFQIIVLILFRNYYVYALALPIAQIMMNIFIYFRSKKMFPDIVPSGELPSDLKKTIKNKVVYLSAHLVTSTFTNSIDNIVISGTIGLTAITLYGNYSYISTAVLSLILIFYRSLAPGIGNALVADSIQKIYNTFSGLRLFSKCITIVCTICLVCLYQPFMLLWLGEDYLLPYSTVILIALYFYVNASRQFLTTVYIGSAGLWDKTLLRQILIAVTNLILDLVLTAKFGIAGIVFASFFTNIVIGLPMDLKIVGRYILDKDFKILFFSEMGYLILTIILIIGMSVFFAVIPAGGIFNFALKVIIAVLIPSVFLVIIFCRSNSFKYLISHLKILAHK